MSAFFYSPVAATCIALAFSAAAAYLVQRDGRTKSAAEMKALSDRLDDIKADVRSLRDRFDRQLEAQVSRVLG